MELSLLFDKDRANHFDLAPFDKELRRISTSSERKNIFLHRLVKKGFEINIGLYIHVVHANSSCVANCSGQRDELCVCSANSVHFGPISLLRFRLLRKPRFLDTQMQTGKTVACWFSLNWQSRTLLFLYFFLILPLFNQDVPRD